MRLTRLFAPLLVCAVLAAPSARAVDGFTIGVEYGRGSWTADPAQVASGAFVLQNPISTAVASVFTNTLTAEPRSGANLHFGWNILGHALVEATLQSAFWNVFDKDTRSGVGLVGGRLTWYPMELAAKLVDDPRADFLRERFYDLGLEFGAGYSIGGGNNGTGQALGMDGPYVAFGLNAEVWHPRAKWVSFVLGWRRFSARWDRFYFDYNNDLYADVKDFSASWNTLSLGLNFHFAAPR